MKKAYEIRIYKDSLHDWDHIIGQKQVDTYPTHDEIHKTLKEYDGDTAEVAEVYVEEVEG